MANKRMFSMVVIDSDAFLDMPLSTQALYFHLSMRADDDGFIGNPKKILRLICASEDDLKLLVAKRFVLTFEDGVIVIKHWRMHNWVRGDRYTPTVYQEELKTLGIKDNKSYTLDKTKCITTKSDIPNDIPNDIPSDIPSDTTLTDSDIDLDLDIDLDIDIDKDKRVNYQQIADMYNNTCVSFPRLTKLSDTRKKAIKARLGTYKLDDFANLFRLAEESEFLKGKNNRNWTANFDWLIKDANMAKVLDGNYKNTAGKQPQKTNKFNNFHQREYDYDKLERELLGNGAE